MALDECSDVAVLGAADEIAFPMAGDGAVLDLRGPRSRMEMASTI
jgi:hypothetical protein